MPIHEYHCYGCEQVFEDLVGTLQNYPEPEACPHCQGKTIVKLVSCPSPAVIPYSGWDADGSSKEENELKNRAWLESPEMAAQIRSGEREMKVPPHLPQRFQPKI